MKTQIALIVGGVLALLAAGGGAKAGAAPLEAPKRIVAGMPVDLAPLFRWCTNHSGARPLTAWVRVTGTIVGTNSYGWVVDAAIDSSGAGATNKPSVVGGKRILLKHPPAGDVEAFASLRAEIQSLEAEKAGAFERQTNAHARVEQLKLSQSGVIRGGKTYNAMAGQRRDSERDESSAREKAKTLDEDLADARKALGAYLSPDRYILDCLALELKQTLNGMPVYDYGSLPQ